MPSSRSVREAEQHRADFEAWISAEPNNFGVSRYPDSMGAQWAGQYRTFTVQLAWCAWQAAIKHLKKTMCNRN